MGDELILQDVVEAWAGPLAAMVDEVPTVLRAAGLAPSDAEAIGEKMLPWIWANQHYIAVLLETGRYLSDEED